MNINTRVELNNSKMMPILGFGVWRAKNGEETYKAVSMALEAGYRSIDTAAIYRNEESVGQAIADSGIDRSEIFLTTKLWNEDQRQSRQREAFFESLKRLQTDYIDLYLIHWAIDGKIEESWKVMEQLVNEGYIRSIGVCNFQIHHLETLLKSATILPVIDQVETHPYLSQRKLLEFLKSKRINLEAWSPLGGGKTNLFDNEVLVEIATKHHKSPAQIILRWDLQRGIISIPKSVHKNRIIENANLFDFALSEDEMNQINELNQDLRSGPDPDHVNF